MLLRIRKSIFEIPEHPQRHILTVILDYGKIGSKICTKNDVFLKLDEDYIDKNIKTLKRIKVLHDNEIYWTYGHDFEEA